jgi:hypothetical protein
MSTTLRDPTAGLLDHPPRSLEPLQQGEKRGDQRRSTVLTDRGRGEFRRNRRGAPARS